MGAVEQPINRRVACVEKETWKRGTSGAKQAAEKERFRQRRDEEPTSETDDFAGFMYKLNRLRKKLRPRPRLHRRKKNPVSAACKALTSLSPVRHS
jgi:hypothetical protein